MSRVKSEMANTEESMIETDFRRVVTQYTHIPLYLLSKYK